MRNFDKYFLMKEEDAIDFVFDKMTLFKDKSKMMCSEIGDGYLNYIFRIWEKDTSNSVILKQATINGRFKGTSVNMSLERNYIEYESHQYINKNVPGFSPKVYFQNEIMACFAMEDLSDFEVLRNGLVEYKHYPEFSDLITTYFVNCLLPGTDLVIDYETKCSITKKFSNKLLDLHKALVFTEPFNNCMHRNVIPQGLEEYVSKNIYCNQKLLYEVLKLKVHFLSNTQSLLHGDLHSGAIMIKNKEIKLIDNEFAFLGPIGYEIGTVVGSLLSAWTHAIVTLSRTNTHNVFFEWIETTIIKIFECFKEKFKIMYFQTVVESRALQDDFFDYYYESIHRDIIGFAGIELIRRTIGTAQIKDVLSIDDVSLKKQAIMFNIAIGNELIMNGKQSYKCGKDIIFGIKELINIF